ncbi:sialidase family protein [Granulicella arctica]|uniref:Xyloglucanase n=1 Tax=Granulicella arctica TaxID=940613 RepID=A0A7Y9THQ4_9BACT|nr:sialidase family protein [Granulicella arctica]NYF80799.1 hypothetical protein [Granulicella arctica]
MSSTKTFKCVLALASAMLITTRGALAQYEAAYDWSNVQIVAGGFVTGILGNPQVPDIRYARTDIGGTYRWDPTTHRWHPLLDFLNTSQFNYIGTESFALDPSNFSRLYLAAGTYTESFEGNGAILISDDFGEHFDIVPLPIKLGSNDAGRFAGERLAVDPNDGRVIYFGSRLNGLYRSTDRGRTWGPVASFPVTGPTGTSADPGVGVIFELFPKSAGTTSTGASRATYVGVSQGSSATTPGLYVTNDGGQSFQPVPGQPLNGFYLNSGIVAPDGSLYFVYGYSAYGNSVGPYSLTDGQVWKYTPPNTATATGIWTNITPPKPSYFNWGYSSVAVDPHNPKIIMVSTMDRYYPPPQDDIYRSTDGGQTWEEIQTNAVRDVSRSPWITFGAATAGAGNWINHLWVNPWDTDQVLYGDGQTIWSSKDISAADGVATTPGTIVNGNPTHWYIDALGVEETSVLALISPPSGPAHLISGVGDIGGFTHTDLRHSPTTGMDSNPILGATTGLDFAQTAPLTIARVGSSGSQQSTGSHFGAYSSDGGVTWTPFPTNPTGVVNGSGTVAVAADGSAIYWQPSDSGSQASVTTDHGTTWTLSNGAPALTSGQIQVFADRIDPATAYLYDAGTGNVLRSTDHGQNFTLISTLGTYGKLSLSPAAKGDLWFASNGPLQRSTDGGVTWHNVGSINGAYSVGFGAAKPGTHYPAVYLFGQVGETTGFYRSTDQGASFVRVNDDQHQYGNAYIVQGDARVYGRIYIGTNGRGIILGQPAERDHR